MTLTDGYYESSYPPSLWGGGEVIDGPPGIDSFDPWDGSITTTVHVFDIIGYNFAAGCTVLMTTDAVEPVPVPITSAVRHDTTRITVTFTPPGAGNYSTKVRNPNGEESFPRTYLVTPTTAEDIAGMSIDDVKAFVVAHPDLLSEVFDLERAGSARAGLLTWLEQLLDEEQSDPEPEPDSASEAEPET